MAPVPVHSAAPPVRQKGTSAPTRSPASAKIDPSSLLSVSRFSAVSTPRHRRSRRPIPPAGGSACVSESPPPPAAGRRSQRKPGRRARRCCSHRPAPARRRFPAGFPAPWFGRDRDDVKKIHRLHHRFDQVIAIVPAADRIQGQVDLGRRPHRYFHFSVRPFRPRAPPGKPPSGPWPR